MKCVAVEGFDCCMRMPYPTSRTHRHSHHTGHSNCSRQPSLRDVRLEKILKQAFVQSNRELFTRIYLVGADNAGSYVVRAHGRIGGAEFDDGRSAYLALFTKYRLNRRS